MLDSNPYLPPVLDNTASQQKDAIQTPASTIAGVSWEPGWRLMFPTIVTLNILTLLSEHFLGPYSLALYVLDYVVFAFLVKSLHTTTPTSGIAYVALAASFAVASVIIPFPVSLMIGLPLRAIVSITGFTYTTMSAVIFVSLLRFYLISEHRSYIAKNTLFLKDPILFQDEPTQQKPKHSASA